MPRILRLNAPPVWLEAEGARRSAATIGSITRLIIREFYQLALAARLQEQALSRRQRRLQALAGQLALGRPVVAQRHDELVRPEAPIMWIWSVDV